MKGETQKNTHAHTITHLQFLQVMVIFAMPRLLPLLVGHFQWIKLSVHGCILRRHCWPARDLERTLEKIGWTTHA
jgi:hypothetical protein